MLMCPNMLTSLLDVERDHPLHVIWVLPAHPAGALVGRCSALHVTRGMVRNETWQRHPSQLDRSDGATRSLDQDLEGLGAAERGLGGEGEAAFHVFPDERVLIIQPSRRVRDDDRHRPLAQA